MMTRLRRSRRLRADSWLALPILSVVTACTDPTISSEIRFDATWNGQSVSCASENRALNDLRFFVSEPVLFDASGREFALQLSPDERWQQSDVVLVDLETGEGACRNGTAATNSSIRGTVGLSDVRGIRFTVGVPFELNHANPLLADAPLDDSAMHWHWRSGYKFLRAGLSIDDNVHWIHLGSTGCEGTVGNISHCGAPNRVVVELPVSSPNPLIEIDLAELFAGVEGSDIEGSECSSGPAEASCRDRFAALGLSFGDVPGTWQRVFKVRQ